MHTPDQALHIPADSSAIAGARRFTEGFLRSHGLSEQINTMVLLISEVVTNAILHGGSGAELRLIVSGGSIRAEVKDRSPMFPSVRQYSEDATTGRGMVIVQALASAWGTRSEGDGKVVWFTLTAAAGVELPAAQSLNISLKRLDPVHSTAPGRSTSPGARGCERPEGLFAGVSR
ncbi:MAG: ATP-binding protein [Actinomycetota bacterium]